MNIRKLKQTTVTAAALGAALFASIARADDKPSPVMTALSATTISGYVDTSAEWNPGTGNLGSPAYVFGGPAKADGFNLNVVKLMIEKDADLADGWGAGYKVDLLFGPDAVAYGTQPPFTAPSSVAVKQAYVDLKVPFANGLEFKMGVWDTLLGYEVFETPLNPNFTKSWGYTIEPATFTGVQATYNFSEMVAATVAVADTLGSSINARAFPPQGPRSEAYKAFVGDISLTAPSDWGWFSGSTLYGAFTHGYDPVSTVTLLPADQTGVYVGSTLSTPLKELKVGLAYDYETINQQAPSTATYAEAFGLYLLYTPTDKLSFNTRAEWFTQSPTAAAIGYPDKIFSLTGTLQYNIWANVISRLEARWDHQADGLPGLFGGTPGGTGQRNAVALIANIIYKF